MEDSQILELFFARSERAVAELSAKYGAACERIARNILKNDMDAEECVDDAYLAAWNTIPPQRPDPLRAYLFRIVRNTAVARYRANTAGKRNSYYDAALEELEDVLASPAMAEDGIEARELTGAIERFLDTLDRESRVLFVRRYWHADSLSDLAERFRTSRNNVSVRLSRTRKKLKKYLMKEGYEL